MKRFITTDGEGRTIVQIATFEECKKGTAANIGSGVITSETSNETERSDANDASVGSITRFQAGKASLVAPRLVIAHFFRGCTAV